MSDLPKTLAVVSLFLVSRGYDQQEAVARIPNGRWIYEWCKDHEEGRLCPCATESVLERLFKLMEEGYFIAGTKVHMMSEAHIGSLVIYDQELWTRADTNVALKAGGFKTWPEDNI